MKIGAELVGIIFLMINLVIPLIIKNISLSLCGNKLFMQCSNLIYVSSESRTWSALVSSVLRYKHFLTFLLLCWQSSPDVLNPKDRSSDLEAISRVIQQARHFIYVSVIDYLPLVKSNTQSSTWRLEPLCHCTLEHAFIIKRLTVMLWFKRLNSVCASLSFWLPARACLRVCAKILVSYRRPHKRGSDLEEGASPSADKLLGKNRSTYFQLHLVPEESVHGAGQLFPGSCTFQPHSVLFSAPPLHFCQQPHQPPCLWLCM